MATLKDDLASLKISQDARAGGGRRGIWALGIVSLLLALGAGGWFWTQRVQAASVRTAAVTSRGEGGASPGAVLNASGYVTARRRATVSSKVTGKVVDIFVEEGKEVQRGQVLARLDDSQIRAALAVARAQLQAARSAAVEDEARLREARLTQQRLERLVQDKVVSRAELDSAEATVKSLEARIALARQQVEVAETQVAARETDLADMVVRAPFDGVAISKDAQPGEMISPVSAGGGFTRTGICTIVDMTSLEVEVDVSESYINRVRPGQPVEAVLDAYQDWRIPAHVITTVPSADRQKATVRVRIGFEQLDPRILPDMGVKVSFYEERAAEPASGQAAPTLLVPKSAVRTVDGQSIVFLVRAERVERRAVRTGVVDGDRIEVLSGLSAGDRVVVEGPDTLTDGARVKEL
ncbi:MAG TPA: efflux RND transporter periplasmic adaptor subunit [Vicinamibacterales bacterium]|nr:efflux RND transporter periplasmic adaptor subunit [Vicinamibacterales bacterium]